VDEVAYMMNVKNRQEESSTQASSFFTMPEMAILKTSTPHATTIPPTVSMITPLPQLMTPSSAPTTIPTTTLILVLPNFSFLFRFDQRVSTLETKLSQLKQADHYAQLLESIKSQLPIMVDDLLSTRIGYVTRTALKSYTKEFEKKAQEERKLYIDVVEKSIKDVIKDEVKTKSLTEFELKKIFLDKIKRSESYKTAPEYKELYEGLSDCEDKDKDEDPSAGSDRWLKKQKTSKDVEPPKGSKSKESKTSSSKGTKSRPKSSEKSVQAEEPVFETTETEMPQDLRGDTEDQPNVEATPMDDWFKKPNEPSNPDRAWNDGKSIDSRPPQKWIKNIAKARQPPRTFDELMRTPIDFSAYVMHNLKIDNLTHEILVGPAFNLLKGTCKSFVELKYHFEECYKTVIDQLDWNNHEGHEYPFDLNKPLSLIEAQGRQVVTSDYFFNQ
nr:hypothetical protein [Tanacetum cinerariifolium]